MNATQKTREKMPKIWELSQSRFVTKGVKMYPDSRVLVWFSCGAASACAAKLSVDKYGSRCIPVYCDTLAKEHPDNRRFLADVERWIGKEITLIRSNKYTDIDDVFTKTRYLNGISGARCTTEMKKMPRWDFQLPDDLHVFGFTSDEGKRIKQFEANNPERCEFILRRAKISKADCYKMIHAAGIELPAMYRLGYKNNNCIGCVKGAKGYWNKIRIDFPERFAEMSRIERKIGHALNKQTVNGVTAPVYLDELNPKAGKYSAEKDIECGPICATGT